MQQRQIRDLSRGCVQHRYRLLASVQVTSYNSPSASGAASAVRVNIETVYSARREADLVLAINRPYGYWEELLQLPATRPPSRL